MQNDLISLNPFSLMMEPENVLQAMEQSTTLRSLKRRVLRPLDKPLIPYAKGKNPYEDIDQEIEMELDQDFGGAEEHIQ